MVLHDFYMGQAFDAHEYFGAHLCREGVIFRLYAPNAKKVEVIGDFNNWDGSSDQMIPLEQSGVLELVQKDAGPGDMYKYRIYQKDGVVMDRFDPYGFGSELRPDNASIIVDLDEWTFDDDEWMKNRTKNYDKPMNIYEVHAGSWRANPEDPEHGWYTYDELGEKLLDYVKDMGYTHVEFLPLTEYPSDSSWGYQASGYFCPTARYGTARQLMKMVNSFHKAGIGVIMDFVPVHFITDTYALAKFDGTALYEYAEPSKGYSEWGTCNFNYYRGEVRSFLQSSAHYWLDRYHFDGIRMDAISNAIYWQGDSTRGVNEGALDFLKYMNQGLNKMHPTAMLIAEDSTNFPKVTAPVEYDGLGFDYKWDMGWMNDTLNYFRVHPFDRKFHYNKLTFSMMYFYQENYMLPFSHDEVVHGKATIIQKMWGDYDLKFQQAKTLYVYMMTHPGKKLNFMGNEIGQFREWDERRECDWMLLDYPKHRAFCSFIRELNKLYITEPAFYHGEYDQKTFRWLEAEAIEERVYIYERMYGEDSFIIVLNMSDRQYNDYEFGYDRYAVLHEVLSGERKEYEGYYNGSEKDLVSQKKGYKWFPYKFTITIPALAAVIYRVESLPQPEEEETVTISAESLEMAGR